MSPLLIVIPALLSAALLTNASNSEQFVMRVGGVSSNPSDASSKTFDYVVVGGGLTGITVAARLAENPAVSVLVVEAGKDNRLDDRVRDIYKYGQVFGSDLDWAWPTDHGRRITGWVGPLRYSFKSWLTLVRIIYSGKTLGGSSSINGAAWTRGLDAQYDAWSQLLEKSEQNLNWNWASMFSYMKKVRIISSQPQPPVTY